MNLNNKILKYLLLFYVPLSFVFGLYYAWEQSRKITDDSFLSVINGKEYLMIGTEESRPSDSAIHNAMASSLLETGSFRNSEGYYTAIGPPGMPIFLAPVYGLFGYRLWVVILINSMLAAISLYIIFRICILMFHEKIAWFAVFLQLINIRFLYHVGSVNYYPLLIFLMLLSFYFTIRLVNGDLSIVKYLTLGFIFGSLMLVRPVFAPFAGILLAYLVFKKKRLNYVLMTFLVSSLMVVSWIGRNYLRLGILTFATYGAKTFGNGNNDAYKNISLFDTYYVPDPDKINELENSSTVEKEQPQKMASDAENKLSPEALWALSGNESNRIWLKNNMRTYLKNVLWRIKGTLSPFTRDMSFRNKFLSTILWLLIIIPGLIGLFILPDIQFKLLFSLSAFSTIVIVWFIMLDSYLHYQIPFQVMLIFSGSYYYHNILTKFPQFINFVDKPDATGPQMNGTRI